jgi:creatinine amidohydrolase
VVVLEELTSRELELVLERGTTAAVIPFGSVEYQGRHLPLGSDALLADVVGRAVADRLDAVLAPTLRVGSPDQHVRGTGTLTVPPETLREVALHIARSLIAQGFRMLVLLSTHGGNRSALGEAAQELDREHPDIEVCVPRGDVGPDPGTHSGRWLTSVMLSLRPDLVDVKSAHDDMKDEVLAATPQAGEKNLERFVSSIVQAVRNASPGTVDSLPE